VTPALPEKSQGIWKKKSETKKRTSIGRAGKASQSEKSKNCPDGEVHIPEEFRYEPYG